MIGFIIMMIYFNFKNLKKTDFLILAFSTFSSKVNSESSENIQSNDSITAAVLTKSLYSTTGDGSSAIAKLGAYAQMHLSDPANTSNKQEFIETLNDASKQLLAAAASISGQTATVDTSSKNIPNQQLSQPVQLTTLAQQSVSTTTSAPQPSTAIVSASPWGAIPTTPASSTQVAIPSNPATPVALAPATIASTAAASPWGSPPPSSTLPPLIASQAPIPPSTPAIPAALPIIQMAPLKPMAPIFPKLAQ
jgi:hypothetical protein